jgi:PHD/YefM family antitoxin component YafN of YafNO toxin-antitoxin module
MTTKKPRRHRLHIPISEAREKLSAMVAHVQNPRGFLVLTRHGEPVAALIGLDALGRVFDMEDVEEVQSGRSGPRNWPRAAPPSDSGVTRKEAAHALLKVQMDRLAERHFLRREGLEPVPGGELRAEMDWPAPVKPRRRWWPFGRRETPT